jgi:hypothetical protein
VAPGSHELPAVRHVTADGYGAEIVIGDASTADLRAYLRELDAFEERVITDIVNRRARVTALLLRGKRVPA